MCPIFDGSPLAFGARYQSFLRVCWYLLIGVTNFVYPSEKFNNLTDIILDEIPWLEEPWKIIFNEKYLLLMT